jgi:hypothetical protein
MIGKKGSSGGLIGHKDFGSNPLIGAAKNVMHGVGSVLDSQYAQFTASLLNPALGAGLGAAKQSGVLEKLKRL